MHTFDRQIAISTFNVYLLCLVLIRFDGRGGGNSGNIRLPPLNSWPDNGNLDKACRFILWPIKRKYGQSISWADLIILAGNVAIESMMGKWGEVPPLWFGGGRVDAFAPEEDVYWGHEPEWLKDDRHVRGKNVDVELEKPLGAVQMGLIYVNPVSFIFFYFRLVYCS
jgi:catalase-peroxidase